MYIDGIMYVTEKDVFRCVSKERKTFLDCLGKESSACIMPGHFCCMQFINNSRCLPKDKSTENRRSTQPRENKIALAQTSFLESPSNLKAYPIIAVSALQSTDTKEEGFIDNGFEFSFP